MIAHHEGQANQRHTTMADVAAKVGVSRQLVGLVFRNAPGVSKKTEAKIRSAARNLGYLPNLAAQSLRGEGSRYIGVAFHTSHSSSEELIPALYKEAELLGFKLVLSAISSNRTDQEAINEIIGHRCEGIILISSHLEPSKLQEINASLPMVSISRRVTGVNCGVVSSEGESGIFDAVKHLVELGHKNISYVHTKEMLDSEFRLLGYKRAVRKFRLKASVINIPGDYVEAAGARAAAKLLETNEPPTAVVCCNDQVALGLVHSLLKVGMRIPSDISVTGYDDTVAKLPFLDLTTVRQDANELAKAAIIDLVDRIAGIQQQTATYLTSAKLVVRSSTAKPRS